MRRRNCAAAFQTNKDETMAEPVDPNDSMHAAGKGMGHTLRPVVLEKLVVLNLQPPNDGKLNHLPPPMRV